MSGVTIVQISETDVTIVQGVENAGPPGPAVIDASYLVLATNTTLTAERVLTAGTGIDFTDAGAGSTLTVDVDPSEFGNGTVPIASLASTPLLASNNLSDVTAATARTNLGLGDSATKNVGTGAGSVAAGDHNHTGVYEAVGVAAALVDDLSGVSNAATARTNLGLGTAATQASSAFDAAGTAASAVSTHAAASDPHGDRAWASGQFQPLDSDLTAIAALSTTTFGRGLLALADAAAGRTALGLGGAATLDVGTTAGTVAAGDDARFTAGGFDLAQSIAFGG